MTTEDDRAAAAAVVLQWIMNRHYPLPGWTWTVEPRKPDPEPDTDS